MTDLQINPSNSDDWELIADLFVAKPADRSGIPKFNLDVQLNSDFIAVEVVASNSKDTWVGGGFIAQVYKFDEFDVVPNQHFVAVNQITLVELSQLATIDFGLVYDPPKYFRDVSIKVWKYNGIQTDLLLQQIAAALANLTVTANVDLSEVNQKLDQILANQNNTQNVDLSEINNKLDAICTKLDNLNYPPQPPQLSRKEKFFLIN